MGCVSSKVDGCSDLEYESNRKSKTSKSTSGKITKTDKSPESSKSKDATRDKKSSAGSSKKKSTSDKTSSSDGKSRSTSEKSTKSTKSSKSGERSGSSSKHSSSKEKSSKTEDKRSKSSTDKLSKSSKSQDKIKSSISSSDKRSSSKNGADNDKSVKKSLAQKMGSSNHKHGGEIELKTRKLSKSSDGSSRYRSETSAKSRNNEITKGISENFGEKDSKSSGDKADRKKNIVNFTPTPKPNKPILNSFDEKPISQSKNITTKSWWEMEDTANSIDSSDLNNQNNDSKGNNNNYSNDTSDRFSSSSQDSKKGINDNEIINDFLEKPPFAKTFSSENENDAGLKGKNDNYGSESRTNGQNGQRRISKSSDFGENHEFKSFSDDFINSTGGNINNSVKIEIPFDDIDDDTPAPSRGGFGGNSPPLRPPKTPPFGFNGKVDDVDSIQPPSPKRTFNTSAFNANRTGDDFDGESQLPSRPTNVPFRRPFQEQEDSEEPVRPKFTPRPKFKRPLPLKRGAGMLYKKATPLVKSPEDVINAIVTRISTLENSKFNEHLKAQKELIDQMEKAPDVFSKLDTPLVIKTAKKIMEVAGGNRSNLARSSLICLGHMFRIFAGSLNPLIVDAMTLCAKKGVSSSPEHLVLASNFCMSTICAACLESKVSSMLVSLYRNNKAHQILCLSGMVVLLDKMGENMVRLKNLDDIVDCSVKGVTSGGVASRTASRNILGMIQTHSKLDNHLNMCKCTEITKVSVRQLLSKYDDESKKGFIDEFTKAIAL